MNKNPGMESVDAEGSTEPLASIKNSKRDHTIYFDNEDGYILFYQEISTGLNHHYGGMVNFARAAESEQCFSK